MNNFWQLIKINLTQLFIGSFNIENKSSNKKKLIYTIIIVVAFIYIAGAFGYTAYQMGSALQAINMEKILIIMAFLLSSIMVFIQVFFSSFNIIFKSKDYEQLSCLPIRSSTIIMSKIISFLIYCYAFSFIFFAPIATIYFIFAGFNFLAFLYTVIGFILLPLFPMAVGISLSFLVNILTARLKHKNLINLLLFLALFVGIMILSQSTQELILNIVNNSQYTINIMGSIYFPAIFISKAVVYGDLLNLLYYLLISLLPILLIVFGISWKYKFFNTYFSQSAKTKEIKYQSKQHGKIATLINKEISRIFSSPMVLLNNCIGPIVLIIFGIASLSGDLSSLIGSFPPFIMMLLIIPIVNLIASTTSTSFSFEGNTFWLLKNLPISLKQIIISKVASMFILFLSPEIIGFIILCFALKLTLLEILLSFVLMIVSILLSALIGLSINLNKCNINWTNEIAMVKQSISVIICMLIGFAIGLIPTIIYINFLKLYITPLIFGLILLFIFIAIIISLIIYLNKKAKFLFNKIN
jgi:ABC-2 type transport system permease protein